MTLPIEGGVLPLTAPHQPFAVEDVQPKPDVESAAPFQAVLESTLGQANTQIQQAQGMADEFAAGRLDDIHGTMLALSKADIQLRMVGNMKNKIVDAFQELWRMQI